MSYITLEQSRLFQNVFYKRVVGFYKMHIYFQLHKSIDEQINQRLGNFEQLDVILVTNLFGRHVYVANYFLVMLTSCWGFLQSAKRNPNRPPDRCTLLKISFLSPAKNRSCGRSEEPSQ